MNIVFDSKTNEVKLRLNIKDIDDAREIKEMMDTKGWKILGDYLEVAREGLIDSGKDCINSEKRNLSDIKFAIIKGFDTFQSLPQIIVNRAEKFIEDQKEREEEINVSDDE